MTALNVTLAIAGAVVLVLGLLAGYIKNRLWVSEPVICILFGAAIGPALLHLVDLSEFDIDRWFLFKEVARLTLGMAVMGAALRLPADFAWQSWRDIAISLGAGLPLMWLSSSILAVLILGWQWLPALLIGAVIAPTDPVLAGSVATGKTAEESVPERLRNLLTAESGANDGLGMLFVMFPILLLTRSIDEALENWLTAILLWEIGAAVVIGLAAGWLSGRLLVWAYNQPFSESHSTVTIGLALTITVLAAVQLIGSDGILAVFAAGLMLNRYVSARETRHEHAQEAIGRFFNLPVFILLGVALPWPAWAAIGWPGLAFAAAILALRRLPWWLLLGHSIGSIRNWREALFMGWFGPIGVASIYYAILGEEETSLHSLWPVATLVITASALAHGVSATPLAGWVAGGRRQSTR